ncbi:alpha/beta fold hydrolase [Natrarchaeobius oligotrophus]|uniref:Alpha/beta hydrolase n=1 Tax=Natrarchaeobius chitinivorans TaxID=1679083 RepID=A0A3N6M7G7_NATCH|nr:alpha/beta hydrolase [Natrarchaeobius chitinivorans]RQG99578.1 alpha/beta hydrolase [Natrarchaeobius chitinivorans]
MTPSMNPTREQFSGHPTIRFGSGTEPLVILPGLSDALEGGDTPKITRVLLERYYMRPFADDFDVYVVKRPRDMPDGITTREMASNYGDVLAEIGPANVLGLSMGGLIAQYLGIKHAEHVRNLVIAIAGPQLSERGREIVSGWLAAGRDGDWADVYVGSIETTYSAGTKRAAYGALLKIPGIIKEPPYPNDFITSAQACLDHDATGELDMTEPETLVIGGSEDQLFDAEDLQAMGTTIPNARTHLIENTGHGAFEERRREFCSTITSFLFEQRSA